MGDDPKPPDEGTDPAQGSVFGQLPDTRAGSRSPRRDKARAGRRPATAKPRTANAATEAGGGASTAKPGGAKTKRSAPGADRDAAGTPAAEAKPTRSAEDSESAEGSGRGLEDVAWAGIAAAAEAATVGVRLAGRAFEALRETVERR
jgi:hypothetical protein